MIASISLQWYIYSSVSQSSFPSFSSLTPSDQTCMFVGITFIITQLIFEGTLTRPISRSGEDNDESGKVMNLLTNDLKTLEGGKNVVLPCELRNMLYICVLSYMIVFYVMRITGSAVFLYSILGWRLVHHISDKTKSERHRSAFVGVLLTILCLPIPARAGKLLMATQTDKMKCVRALIVSCPFSF